jgi:hypothetical protein
LKIWNKKTLGDVAITKETLLEEIRELDRLEEKPSQLPQVPKFSYINIEQFYYDL